MPEIAFVTTCKGRLHHLQKTLPLIVAQSPSEIIVVDYGCPDNTGDWVEANFPSVKVVRVNDDPGFCAAKARNLGAKSTTAPWLCFIDADVQIASGWLEWMQQHLDSKFFYRAAPVNGIRDPETWGTTVCSRKAFEVIGGYDEAFRGWGGEDDDLYARLSRVSLTEAEYPSHYVDAIHHEEQERLTFYDIKNRALHKKINLTYSDTKRFLLSTFNINTISQFWRQSLMAQLKSQFIKLALAGSDLSVFPEFLVVLQEQPNSDEPNAEHGNFFAFTVARKRRYIFFGPRKLEIKPVAFKEPPI